MKNSSLSFLLIALLACSHSPTKLEERTSDPDLAVNSVDLSNFKLITGNLSPGQGQLIKIPYASHLATPKIQCAGEEIGFDRQGETIRAFIAVDYFYNSTNPHTPFECQLHIPGHAQAFVVPIIKFETKDYPYKISRIRVNKKHVDLSPEAIARWQDEKATLEKVYSQLVLDRSFFDTPFQRPLSSKITGPYGSKRVFNDKKESWHSGVDLRAGLNTPVPVTNSGVVAFKGELFFNGHTVIVDHGIGISSMYCHLNKIEVEVGQKLSRGDHIGLSGNTGRSNAPHLHWGMRVQGKWIDGANFVKLGI